LDRRLPSNIARFGFDSPILVDAKGGIIAGHGRYLAALRLGLETVLVIILANGRTRRMHLNGRVRSGRLKHNSPAEGR
jgi:ParB-like chromosome segregation protein Spo0J